MTKPMIVTVNGQPVQVAVVPNKGGFGPSLPQPLSEEEVLRRVPSVRDLPRWEDG